MERRLTGHGAAWAAAASADMRRRGGHDASKTRFRNGWIMVRTHVHEPATTPVTLAVTAGGRYLREQLAAGLHTAAVAAPCGVAGSTRFFVPYDGPALVPSALSLTGADGRVVRTGELAVLVVSYANAGPRAVGCTVGAGGAMPRSAATPELAAVAAVARALPAVRTGDVLLQQPADEPRANGLADRIRRVTGSPWHHCGCLVRDGRRVLSYEATSNAGQAPSASCTAYLTGRFVGVWCVDLLMIVVCDSDRSFISPVPPLAPVQATRLRTALDAMVGTPYANWDLLRAALLLTLRNPATLPQRDGSALGDGVSGRVFCSQLVVMALQCATAGDPRFVRFATVDARRASPGHVAALCGPPAPLTAHRGPAPPLLLLRARSRARGSAAGARERG